MSEKDCILQPTKPTKPAKPTKQKIQYIHNIFLRLRLRNTIGKLRLATLRLRFPPNHINKTFKDKISFYIMAHKIVNETCNVNFETQYAHINVIISFPIVYLISPMAFGVQIV